MLFLYNGNNGNHGAIDRLNAVKYIKIHDNNSHNKRFRSVFMRNVSIFFKLSR